jgi:ethanolamine transporter EutH
MKKVVLFCLFGCISVVAFAAFPIEAQTLITDSDPESFKLDALGFIIGILTTPFLLLYGLPLALLFINKKNFRKSLALGWLAGLVLLIIIVVLVSTGPDQLFLY